MTKTYPTLYKRTSTGAIQVWWMEQNNDSYRTHSGKQGGAIVVSAWTTCETKNAGRANEVTPVDQATREVESQYTLKQKGGYRETLDTVDDVGFKPMLAKEFEDRKPHVQKVFDQGQSVVIQPKLDGMRCIASAEGLVSRAGNPITSVPHIVEALTPLFAQYPDLILDGELYNHHLKDDFPKLMSLVKKQKPSAKDFEESRVIEYHIYDSPTHRQSLQDLLVGTPSCLVTVPSTPVSSFEAIDTAHMAYLNLGFEGTMIRLPGEYEQKRSNLLLKYKPEQDNEYTIVSINEGNGNRSGMAGYAVMRLDDQRTFRANIKGDRAYLTKLFQHRQDVIGKEATVLFFHLSPDGVPRFPRIKVIHDTPRW